MSRGFGEIKVLRDLKKIVMGLHKKILALALLMGACFTYSPSHPQAPSRIIPELDVSFIN
jgi:hypothetical protein